MEVHIRWMIKADMPEVVEMERNNAFSPWYEEFVDMVDPTVFLERRILKYLRQRNCIGMVALYKNTVVGFMIYELTNNKLHLTTLTVGESYKQRYIGTKMIGKLLSKLSNQRRSKLIVDIRETNTIAIRFLSTLGFKAVGVERDYYGFEDAYTFVKRVEVCQLQ